MDLFARDDLRTLLAERQSPCVSFFVPIEHGGGKKNSIRLKTCLKEAIEQLVAKGHRSPDVRNLLEATQPFLEDPNFWKHQSDGLACFLAPEFLRLYRLPLTFRELVVVGDRFHIRPLVPLLSESGRFYVLALSQNAVRLLQGTRSSVSEVDLKGVPRNLAEALLTHEAKEPFSFYGRRAGEGAGSWGGIFHGHGVGIDDSKDELLHYFQKIDRGLHSFLKEERAPLVLAAVDYLLPIYRKANTYPPLLEGGIEGNPDRLSNQELHKRAWTLIQPFLKASQQKATSQYQQLVGTGRTASELEQIVSAAHHGHIETLFVALHGRIWGRFDPAAGTVEVHDREQPGDEDLLNVATIETIHHAAPSMRLSLSNFPTRCRSPPSFVPAGLCPRIWLFG